MSDMPSAESIKELTLKSRYPNTETHIDSIVDDIHEAARRGEGSVEYVYQTLVDVEYVYQTLDDKGVDVEEIISRFCSKGFECGAYHSFQHMGVVLVISW